MNVHIPGRRHEAAGGGRAERGRRVLTRRRITAVITAMAALLCLAQTAHASSDSLAPTPPMGWNSYNAYACDNGARNMEAVANFIAKSGLEADGYQYVNADGCYDDLEGVASPNTYAVNAPAKLDPETCGAVNGRLPDGRLFVNSYLFPPSSPCADDGFQLVGDYLHARGLKLGLYLDASNNWNCEEIPGSDGFDQTDADTLAGWGVDYVKADWGCRDTTQAPGSNGPAGYTGIDAAPGNTGFGGPTFSTNPAYDTDQQQTQTDMYTALSQAIANAGRPMVFSIAGAGTIASQQWGLPLADLDRPTGDANANFTATGRAAAGSIVGIVNADAENYASLTGPDHWIDPDIMEVGNGSLTPTEDRSEMSMFSEMADPLIMSTNLCRSGCGPDTTPATAQQLALDVSVFGNQRVIAVDQDPQGSPASIVGTFDGTHLVMARPLANGDVAVTLFNESTTTAATMSTTASAIGLDGSGPYRITNLWGGAVKYTNGVINAKVPATGTVMLRVSPASSSSATRRSEAVRRTGRAQRVAPHPAQIADGTGATTASGPIPGNLLSLACPADGQCSAVDILGQQVTFDPATPAAATTSTLASGQSLAAVSCPSATECVALTDGGVARIFNPQTTPVRSRGAGQVDLAKQPTALSCPSTDQCTAVDGEGDEVTFDPTYGTVTGRAAVDQYRYLAAVTCPSTTECVATGGGGNSGDTVVSFDPTTGAVIAPPTSIDPATGNGLSSVACPTLTQCTAADGSGNEVTFDPTTMTVNPAGVVALEGSVAAAEGVFNSVACPAATQCTAVDAYGNEVTFDPTTGTVNAAGVQAVDPSGNGLESVACDSAGDSCTAVDLDGDEVTFDPTTGSPDGNGVTQVDPGQS